MTTTKMDEATWEQTFKPIQNHLDDNASLDGVMFETYGDELEFVKSQPDANIWTYCDDGENGWLVNGFHLVNRLGYVVTETPYTGDYLEVHLYDLSDFDDADEVQS